MKYPCLPKRKFINKILRHNTDKRYQRGLFKGNSINKIYSSLVPKMLNTSLYKFSLEKIIH